MPDPKTPAKMPDSAKNPALEPKRGGSGDPAEYGTDPTGAEYGHDVQKSNEKGGKVPTREGTRDVPGGG